MSTNATISGKSETIFNGLPEKEALELVIKAVHEFKKVTIMINRDRNFWLGLYQVTVKD